MTKADEASTSKREKDVEMGGSGSHGHGDSTCTETQWVEYIEKKLDENRVSRQAGIAKVPKFCRDINEAYKPCIISIGPFHRGNSETEPMEQHKWQCLNYILSRKSISYLKECFKVLKKLEVDARCSYLDDFQLDSMYFMEMMLLDGCFIVDYLRQSSNIPFIKPWMKPQIDNDLLLMENQLPFFVLENIFLLVKGENEGEGLENLGLKFCRRVRPANTTLTASMLATRNLQHLLHFYHAYLFYDDGSSSIHDMESYQIRTIHSASFLKQSGIEFKRLKPTNKVLDVSFSVNGVIRITPLVIDAYTSSQFRNLIAFEKFNPSIEPRFTAFAGFMDYIINTSTDVTLLRKRRIIEHALGSDDEVATIFNQLNTRTFDYLPSDLVKIYKEADVFYGKRRNKWKAILKQKYMDSPWAIISIVFGGVLVLLLTIIQAVYAILSYYKPAS